jgi:Immunoglobulin domain/Immunoglobulin I-set domain
MRRLRATFLTALVALSPFYASAEPVVFNADFSGTANTVLVNPSIVTPTGTTWCGMYNKANTSTTPITVSEFGMVLASPGSSSALEEVACRITNSPINITQVGDYIELTGSFIPLGFTNLAIGLFNSGGVDPLVTRSDGVTTMLNNGMGTTATVNLTGGTIGWKGYRALSTGNSATASFVARPAQTSGTNPFAYELLSPGVNGFTTPGGIAVGTVTNSTITPLKQWRLETGFGAQYDFLYRIQRSSALVFSFTFSITDHATATPVFATSGSTTTTTAQPLAITSAFDAVAIGGRVDTSQTTTPPAGSTTVNLQIVNLKVTAHNSEIATITTQPVAQNIAMNGAGSLTVGATGTAPITYQWYKDSALILGATSSTYNIASATSGDVGSYYVVATNSFGSETSSIVAVNVGSVSAPAFTTQPTAQNVDAGSTLTLTTAVTGVPTPTYKWFHDNVEIAGATTAIYTVAVAAASDAGNYKLQATNSQGTVTSDIVAVTINSTAPVFTVQPAPTTTVNVGTAINLTVTATGLPAPTYQWYKDTVLISGANSSIYTVPNATTADAGTHSYTVTASNPTSTVTSNAASVTINMVSPSITTQPPAALTVHYGKRITLSAAYAGSPPLTYQWYKDATLITGATASSYTISSAVLSNAGSYHVVVTNLATSATSNDTVVSVPFANETGILATNFSTDTLNNPLALITSTSTSWWIMSGRLATNCSVGDDATTAEVVETRPLTLTWVTPAGSAIVETAGRFSSSPVSLSSVGDYLRVNATMSGTNLLYLCFGLFNSGGVSPVALDGSVTNETLGGGTSAIGIGTQNWVGYRSALVLAGTSGDVGTRPAQTATTSHRGQELLFPAGSTGAAFGEPAGTSVGIVPGVGATIALTNNAVYTLDYAITLSAANQYTISYSVYAGSSATGTPLYGTNATTTAAAALPSAVTSAFDSFAIGLRNSDGATSPTLVITNLSVVKGNAVAGAAPAITTQPTAQNVAVGATLTLTAAASGTPAPTYQWYLDNAPISGATSATYSVGSAAAGNAGSYKVIATNVINTATSNSVTVTVGSASTPYQTWSTAKGLTSGVNDGVSQDPDGDGINNLLEFALNGDPLAASTSLLPVVTTSGANVILTYDIQVAALASHSITAESSPDLVTWTAVANGVNGASINEAPLNGTTDHVIVTVPASGSRTFLRVKVAQLP